MHGIHIDNRNTLKLMLAQENHCGGTTVRTLESLYHGVTLNKSRRHRRLHAKAMATYEMTPEGRLPLP